MFRFAVRTRVNEWVSSFVTEMRSKRPAVVQKLVSSVPTSVTTRNFADKPFETETVSIPDIGNGNELETKSNVFKEYLFKTIIICKQKVEHFSNFIFNYRPPAQSKSN